MCVSRCYSLEINKLEQKEKQTKATDCTGPHSVEDRMKLGLVVVASRVCVEWDRYDDDENIDFIQ